MHHIQVAALPLWSAGAHKVWVKNAAGCEASTDVTVRLHQEHHSNGNGHRSYVCGTNSHHHGKFTTAGLEYKLDNGTYASYPSGGFTSVSAGAHKVWVKNAAGCEASTDVTVNDAPGAPW